MGREKKIQPKCIDFQKEDLDVEEMKMGRKKKRSNQSALTFKKKILMLRK